MKIIIYTVFGMIGFVVLVGVVWRFFSNRVTIPCPVWLHWMVEMDNPFTKTNRAAVIIGHLNLKPGMTVLDAGCGPGRLTIPLAKKVGPSGKVVAMDIQQGMLDRVQEKATTEQLRNITFFNAGLGDGRLEHNCYDFALLVTVLGEIPRREAALQELFDTLKPGGILSITELIFDPHFQSKKTVRRLAKTVGFQEKNCYGNWFAFTIQFEKPFHPQGKGIIMNKKRLTDYQEQLLKKLQNEKFAKAYLNEALGDGDPCMVLLASKNIIAAQELVTVDESFQSPE